MAKFKLLFNIWARDKSDKRENKNNNVLSLIMSQVIYEKA